MAEIKIAADSGGGSVGLVGPSTTTGNAALQLKLPVADGSANQLLKTDGSGNLGWSTGNGYVSYALIVDKKNADTDGGTFTSGAWRTRDLNTILVNEDSICAGTSGNDSFTLIAGTYLIKWSAPAYEVQHHTTKLHDETADAIIAKGTPAYDQSGYSMGRSWGSHVVTITSNNDYKIKHKCSTTRNTDGLGLGANLQDEYYTIVEVWRYA